jgi:hypothetical protein
LKHLSQHAYPTQFLQQPKPPDRAKQFYFCCNFEDSLDDDDEEEEEDDINMSNLALSEVQFAGTGGSTHSINLEQLKIHMCHLKTTGTGPRLMTLRRCQEKNCTGRCSLWHPQWLDHLSSHCNVTSQRCNCRTTFQSWFMNKTVRHCTSMMNWRVYLDESLSNRWIGCGGLMEWPSRPTDLTPMGFPVVEDCERRCQTPNPAAADDGTQALDLGQRGLNKDW